MSKKEEVRSLKREEEEEDDTKKPKLKQVKVKKKDLKNKQTAKTTTYRPCGRAIREQLMLFSNTGIEGFDLGQQLRRFLALQVQRPSHVDVIRLTFNQLFSANKNNG